MLVRSATRPTLALNINGKRSHVDTDTTNGLKRQKSTNNSGATSADSGKHRKMEPKMETLTFSVHHQSHNKPPTGNEIERDSDLDDEMVTTTDIKADDLDDESMSDDELPQMEPKPRLKRK